MIQFNYTGNPYPSFKEQQEAKTAFIEKLGPFKEEFDAKDGIVTFNFSYPPTDNKRISFVLGPSHNLGDFIMRWNEYIRGLEGYAGE